MILDKGIVNFFHEKSNSGIGNMPGQELIESYSAWYGTRTVGYNRMYTAKQANVQVDALIRILEPPEDVFIYADDICRIEDGLYYRIKAVQHLRDEDSGDDVLDITLTRIGEKYGNNRRA